MRRIYFDHSATTPVDPRVVEAMRICMLDNWGNPSSIHLFGREARIALDEARVRVARLLNSSPDEIHFTSGGTEADNIALIGFALANRADGNHVIIGALEHPAVLNSAAELEGMGFQVTRVKPDQYGEIRPEAVAEALRRDTLLVSVMHVNNEIGTINDIGSIGLLCRKRGVVFHTDAVQSYGKIHLDVAVMSIDMASVSSHKIYGPKGAGALFIRKGLKVQPLLHGGHQENGVRVGTENMPGIVGLGMAAAICRSDLEAEAEKLRGLRDELYHRLTAELDALQLNGHPTRRLPGNLNLTFKGVESEALLMILDQHGIAVSSGSACSSGSTKPSPVLTGIGLSPEDAHSTLRFTLGRENTLEDVEYASEVIISAVKRLRAMAGNLVEVG